MKRTRSHLFLSACAVLSLALAALPASVASAPALQQADDPAPPDQTVRLIFIHHSTGENWLRDDYGGLGLALGENNYFVSDTNYGWGPDSIGDRTDIPDWTEWFASDQTPIYMEALFNEAEQHAEYTRSLPDPGGENQVILFKSCFPNSALEGNPDDPPDPEGWLTVGHAKYVYNHILEYFATRPDKLFIVITAPPLSDGTYADNARAFNDWLLNDWLVENNYQLSNVAVFDFYNVLTARDAHHWYHDGQIEHLATNRNTLHYPSGDDHPSEAGSRKATEEFLPLLNIYYHRWAASAPVNSPESSNSTQAGPTVDPGALPASGSSGLAADGLLADFDTRLLSLSAYWDEATSTRVDCRTSDGEAYSGSSALKIDFAVAAGSWSTCVLSFDSVQDLSSGDGLAFALHADRAGLSYQILIYAGDPEAQESYLDDATTPQDSQDGWAMIEIPWSDFHRVEWEADAGAEFDQAGQILSVAFGFSGQESSTYTGTVWVDDLRLMGFAPVEGQDGGTSNTAGGGVPCLGNLLVPLLLFGFFWIFRKR